MKGETMKQCLRGMQSRGGVLALATTAVFATLSSVTAAPIAERTVSPAAKTAKAGEVYKLAFTFGNGHDRMNNSPEQLFGPNGITFDPAGNAYVTSQSNPSIKKFTHKGAFLSGIYTPASALYSATHQETTLKLASDSTVFPSPEGPHIQDVSMDKAGNIFATFPFGGQETIARMDEQGQNVKAFRLPARPEGGYNPPEGLAVAQDSTLYVGGTDSASGWQIYHLTNSGVLIGTTRPVMSGPLQYSVSSVKVDKNNNVFVLGDNVINKLDQTGKILWSLSGVNQKARSFQASNIALDGAGNIYISDAGNNCIQVLDGDGKFLTTFTRPQAYPADKFVPGGIAVDDLGVVYVCDTLDNQVDVFKPISK